MRQFLCAFSIFCCAFAECYSLSNNLELPLCIDGGVSATDIFYHTQLPPGYLPFEEFEKEFKLGAVSTEAASPITITLSQTMHTSVLAGLELLLEADEKIITGLEDFIPSIESRAPALADNIRNGGRVFLIGSGSSGRVAVDIAAKCCRAFPACKNQILGMIAGGDSALIRAREGFEDSEADGRKAFEEYNLGPLDTIILISASGSASFNVGCGHFAAERGASVFYFYNSINIPLRTQQLFDRAENPVIPLCVDIGPQAIAGSTRLQGATLAEAGIGAFLASALYLHNGQVPSAQEYPHELVLKLQKGVRLIREQLQLIEKFVVQEHEVFSNPHSNFRQLRDVSDQGYVTFIASQDCMREVLIDATETSPTFSTNPIRREGEGHKKKAEFQAYMVGVEDNCKAWQLLVGRDIHKEDVRDTEAFILACTSGGQNSYQKRPKARGNFLIGVAKLEQSQQLPREIADALEDGHRQGGQIGLLVLCKGKKPEMNEPAEAALVMEDIPYDAIGITETIILKQILNLISNGSMVLMNKVHGNQMIDVRASNRKLIDRCMRLIKEIACEYHLNLAFSDKELYHVIAQVSEIKKSYEVQGLYTPSVVKIVLAMRALNRTPSTFQEIVDYLGQKSERIDWIGELAI